MRLALVKSSLAAVAALAFVAVSTNSWALEIERTKLDNGAVLLMSAQHQLPMVSMAIAFDAGARRDPKGKEGLASLTAASLTQGTKDLSANEFNQKVDFMGSSISVTAGRDYTVATLTSLKKYQDQTLHLMTQILQDPGLRNADIQRKLADQVAGIRASEEQPGYIGNVTFTKELFGDEPYGHPIEGYADSVSKLTERDVRDFYRGYYRIGTAIIAVSGDIDTATVKEKLSKEFASLRGTVVAQLQPPSPSVSPGIHAKLVDRNVAQANLVLGAGGIARSNPDYYNLQVMNYILGGGGFASRLMKVVRSQAGLAYGVASGFQTGLFPGAFMVVVQTKNQSANDALKLIIQQLHKIQSEPVSDAEIASAKKFLIGSFPLKIDRQSQIVSFMLEVELYGLGLDYAERYPKLIGAVTKADVQQVAQKYLHPDALDLVAVANQAEAKIDVANLEPRKQASAATP
jgi:zinc protease